MITFRYTKKISWSECEYLFYRKLWIRQDCYDIKKSICFLCRNDLISS